MSYHGIEIAHIVAMSKNQCIGINNTLPWHISADLQHFKRHTQGGVIVMGRNTYESIGAKPLPKRSNWVLTSNTRYPANGANLAHSLEAVLHNACRDAKNQGLTRVWLIGGAELFNATLDIADVLEITHVHTHIDGDTFYPNIPTEFAKTVTDSGIDEKSELHYQFVHYQK